MKTLPSFILFTVPSVVCLLWLAAVFELCPRVTVATIEPLFTGLALVMVAATFSYERASAAADRQDFVSACQAIRGLGSKLERLAKAIEQSGPERR